MIISLINHTDSIPDREVQRAVRAVNRQIRADFEPYWHLGAELRLEGKVNAKPNPTAASLPELRGDAILYLWDENDIEGALGYHDSNFAGLPFGFVFTQVSEMVGEPWSVTLSHEALELIGDANVNVYAAGPHPQQSARTVFHWYEMCDAVQAEVYEIDGVPVSNFVLPLYFTINDEKGARNDFLGTKTNGKTLKSFGVNPGGYIGFYDPSTKDHETFSMKGDHKAALRRQAKTMAGFGRRALRLGEQKSDGTFVKVAGRRLADLARSQRGILVPRLKSDGTFATVAAREEAALSHASSRRLAARSAAAARRAKGRRV